MEIVKDIHSIQWNKTSVTLGKFDGVHLGHRMLMESVISAKENGCTPTVFTFDKFPSQFLRQEEITSILIEEEKDMTKKVLEYFGVSKVERLSQKAKDILETFNASKTHYQTDRYYAYACGTVEQQKTNATINGYVLFPNYALHNITGQLQKTLFKENYTPITYKQVHSFFYKLKGSDVLSENESKYLDDFLEGLAIHTKEIDNSFEEEMKNRFFKKIKV